MKLFNLIKKTHFILLLGICFCTFSCKETSTTPPEVKDLPPAEEVEDTRGVWLTNVDSRVLNSKAGIEAAVDLCKRNGINTIFVVTWNGGYTLYPSQVMKDEFGINIHPEMKGRDPLQEVIDAAHAQNIKVIAWFEYGFATSYNKPDDGGHLLQAKPHWAAIDTAGNIASKNNFQWMNAFDPEVQNFMISLLSEAVKNYDLDGIQGDDRLPALPSLAGYDSLTIARYENEFGSKPPQDYLDSQWINWRADLLNQFMKRVHDELKAVDPEITISVSPSIFPWSKEQYLQDWPTWVAEGWVDMVCPQIYRYDIEKYRLELAKIVNQQVPKEKQGILFPGILLKVGDYTASEEFLQKMIDENRKNNLNGEVFFFYEGMKRRSAFFEQIYRP